MPLENPRVTLPKHLSETLNRLEDAELLTLFREVTVEVERRAAMKPVKAVAAPQTTPAAKVPARQSKSLGALTCSPSFTRRLIESVPLCSETHLWIARG